MADSKSYNFGLLFLFWAGVAAIFVGRSVFNAPTVPLFADTDDAMRMVMVRDFLGGQGWYDLVQHRLNTPFGAEIHWSRLVDLGIGGLVLVARPLLGANADIFAAYAGPLLLLLALLALSTRIAIRFAGPDGMLPGLVLPLLSAAVLAEFAPGRIDHHNVQIVLTLAIAVFAIEALDRPRLALWSGLAAATSLAIGTEGLPQVAAAILAFGLMFVVDGRHVSALRLFGLSFGLGTLAHLIVALPPARWFEPACDVLAAPYALVGIGTGIGFVVLSLLPLRQAAPLIRLGAGIIAGGVLLGAFVLLFPACLAGPYAAIDPWLQENWIGRIVEAKPLWESVVSLTGYSIGVAFPPLFGLVLTLIFAVRATAEQRGRWLVLALFLAMAVVVMIVQIRGARLAAALAVPAAACLIGAARKRYLATQALIPIVGLVLSWVGFAGLVQAGAISLIAPRPDDVSFAPVLGQIAELAPGSVDDDAPPPTRLTCFLPQAFTDLAGLPPERLMTPIDLGAHVLLYTPHSVVSAPYHRNQQGVRDTFRFFNEPAEDARAILAERGIGVVVTCPYLPELGGLGSAAEDSLVRQFASGTLPDWLTDVTPPGSLLRVYSVSP